MAGLLAAEIAVAAASVETVAVAEIMAAETRAGVVAAVEKVAGAAEIVTRMTITAIPFASRANLAGNRFTLMNNSTKGLDVFPATKG